MFFWGTYYYLSSELICVSNVFRVAVKGITFSKEASTPEKGFLKG